VNFNCNWLCVFDSIIDKTNKEFLPLSSSNIYTTTYSTRVARLRFISKLTSSLIFCVYSGAQCFQWTVETEWWVRYDELLKLQWRRTELIRRRRLLTTSDEHNETDRCISRECRYTWWWLHRTTRRGWLNDADREQMRPTDRPSLSLYNIYTSAHWLHRWILTLGCCMAAINWQRRIDGCFSNSGSMRIEDRSKWTSLSNDHLCELQGMVGSIVYFHRYCITKITTFDKVSHAVRCI